MDRTDWLSDADVAGFACYLADVVHGIPGTLVQRYRPRKADERHREVDVSCFAEAVASFVRAGRDLGETMETLAWTNAALRDAVRRDDIGEALARSVDIIAWGGASNDATAKCLVRRHDAGALPRDIASATRALLSDDDTSEAFRDNVLLRSDAAMAKVYAANDPRIVVYDDRVGAALGRLAREYLVLAGHTSTPGALAFMSGTERRRNPSDGAFRFTRKRGGERHALWSQRATWLVADVLSDPRSRVVGNVSPIDGDTRRERLVEAGLSVIGYDIGTVVSIDVPLRPVRRSVHDAA